MSEFDDIYHEAAVKTANDRYVSQKNQQNENNAKKARLNHFKVQGLFEKTKDLQLPSSSSLKDERRPKKKEESMLAKMGVPLLTSAVKGQVLTAQEHISLENAKKTNVRRAIKHFEEEIIVKQAPSENVQNSSTPGPSKQAKLKRSIDFSVRLEPKKKAFDPVVDVKRQEVVDDGSKDALWSKGGKRSNFNDKTTKKPTENGHNTQNNDMDDDAGSSANDYLAIDPKLSRHLEKVVTREEFLVKNMKETDKKNSAWKAFRDIDRFEADHGETKTGIRTDLSINESFKSSEEEKKEDFLRRYMFKHGKELIKKNPNIDFSQPPAPNDLNHVALYRAALTNWNQVSKSVVRGEGKTNLLAGMGLEDEIKEAKSIHFAATIKDKMYTTLKTIEEAKEQLQILQSGGHMLLKKKAKKGEKVMNENEWKAFILEKISLYQDLEKKYNNSTSRNRDDKNDAVRAAHDDDVQLASKKQKTNTKQDQNDQQLVQLGTDGSGNDAMHPTQGKDEAPKKKLFGKEAQLQKLKERNAKLTQQLYHNQTDTDSNDWVARARQDEIELLDKSLGKAKYLKEQAEKHTEYINKATKFIKDMLKRAKDSKKLIEQGKEPLHEYDHFVQYPIDVAAIYDKLGADEETCEGMDWLQNKRGLIFDWQLTKGKLQKEEMKRKEGMKKKDGEERGDNSKDNDFTTKQTFAYQLNSKMNSKESLRLRPLTTKDTAYIKQQQNKVARMEEVLKKENRFVEFNNKRVERDQQTKRLNQKTKQGQPVMKHQVKNLLKKISSTYGQ